MRHIKEWMKITEAAGKILEKEPENKTAQSIRNSAGDALIRAGYPYEETDIGPQLEVCDRTFIVAPDIVSDQGSSAHPEASLVILSEENKRLTEEKERLEKILYDAFMSVKHDDPVPSAEMPAKETYTVSRPVKEVTEEDIMSDGSIEKISETYEEQETATSDEYKETENPVSEDEKEDVKEDPGNPSDVDEGYQDHIAKNDIVFTYHKVVIENGSGLITRAEVIVSPLSMKEGDSEVIAWINDGIKTETRISENGRKSVLLQVGDVPLIVTGKIENGKFAGKVEVTHRMALSGVTLTDNNTLYDGKGHILVEDDGISVRIVPLSNSNKASGNAEFFYAITEDGQAPITGDTSENDIVRFKYKGQPFELLCRWNSDVLYSAVRPA